MRGWPGRLIRTLQKGFVGLIPVDKICLNEREFESNLVKLLLNWDGGRLGPPGRDG
jgi:hypothetical protein